MKEQCILGMLYEIDAISEEFIEARLRAEHVPILQKHIPLFFILPEDGSPVLFNEIASEWKISKSSLSNILDKYEMQGLIEKDFTCEDRRCVRIRMKPEAAAVKTKLQKMEAEFLDIMMHGFSKEERKKLEQNIEEILKNVTEG